MTPVHIKAPQHSYVWKKGTPEACFIETTHIEVDEDGETWVHFCKSGGGHYVTTSAAQFQEECSELTSFDPLGSGPPPQDPGA